MFALLQIWLVLSLCVAWVVPVLAVVLDARARIDNPSAAFAAGVLATALPVAGALLWLLVRPAETLQERRERRLADAVSEAEAQAPRPPLRAPAATPAPALRRAA
jgi:hypothetical protein